MPAIRIEEAEHSIQAGFSRESHVRTLEVAHKGQDLLM